jgi:hypothetical protein
MLSSTEARKMLEDASIDMDALSGHIELFIGKWMPVFQSGEFAGSLASEPDREAVAAVAEKSLSRLERNIRFFGGDE